MRSLARIARIARIARTLARSGALLAIAGAAALAPPHAAVQPPVLKWQKGGCFTSWCETGWYSSPAVADLDRDGTPEVIGSAYSIVALDGRTGALEWRISSGHDRSQPGAGNVGRTWPGIVVADLDADGTVEIASAHSGGWVSVYDAQGYFKAGWPRQPTTSELRGLGVADLDGDGKLEAIVTAAIGSQTNTWIFSAGGVLRAGWPQLQAGAPGYAWGVYNANAAAGDLDGDGTGEIVVPSDVHYLCAYEANGQPIPASTVFGAGKVWGQVGVWESQVPELRGWGACDGVRAESYRTNFADGAAVLADVDGDGSLEAVVTGNTYDCSHDPYLSRYHGVHLFNRDRSRYNKAGRDWRSPPVDTGAPIAEDYNTIESAQPNPAVADLDGDGTKEIVYSAYDGRVHAFWLDKTEHGSWPYAVYRAADGFFRFASEPAIADLDADGKAEVIVASWTQKGSGANGRLTILSWDGKLLQQVDLPAPFGGGDWNGALAAPTLADLDGDADLEIVLNTAHSGLVAYDLPGTAGARVLWGSGRGGFLRGGACAQPRPAEVRDSLRVTRSGTADIRLAWSAAAGAASYRGYRSTSAQMTGATRIGETTALALVDPGAQQDGVRAVFYQVRGANGCGVE